MNCLRCNDPIEGPRERLGALFCLDCRGSNHAPEKELLRAECNRLAAERDLLEQRVKGLRFLRAQDAAIIEAHRRDLRRYQRLFQRWTNAAA